MPLVGQGVDGNGKPFDVRKDKDTHWVRFRKRLVPHYIVGTGRTRSHWQIEITGTEAECDAYAAKREIEAVKISEITASGARDSEADPVPAEPPDMPVEISEMDEAVTLMERMWANGLNVTLALDGAGACRAVVTKRPVRLPSIASHAPTPEAAVAAAMKRAGVKLL